MSADVENARDYPTCEVLRECSYGHGSCLSYGPQPVVTDPWAEAFASFFGHVVPAHEPDDPAHETEPA